MEIKVFDDLCVLTPLSSFLDKREVERLAKEVQVFRDKAIALDLSFVENCTMDFFETVKKIKNLSVYNISADIFVLFNFMGFDKILNLYVDELDFIESKRRILNRKFLLVK